MGIEKMDRRPKLTPPQAIATMTTPGAPGFDIAIAEAKTVLSAAQLEGMFAAPVNVLPAPQANQTIIVDQIMLQLKPGGTQFTGGGAVTLVYHGTAINPHSSSVPAATINSAMASENVLPPPSTVVQAPPGVGIDITNATAPFAAGNGTAVVKIYYKLSQG